MTATSAVPDATASPPTRKYEDAAAPPVVHVRPLEARDIAAVANGNDDTRDFCERALERNSWADKRLRVFVAEIPSDDGSPTVVGCAYVGLKYPPYYAPLPEDVGQLYLADLQVHEPYRRRGVATKMLQHLADEGRRLGLQVFRAECEKGWRVDLYKRVGFQPVPYRGPADNYPDTHQMLELWYDPALSSSQQD